MPPRDPTNAQISSRLSYAQHTPSFLLKFQNRIAGIPDEPDPDEYSGSYGYDRTSGGGNGEGEFYDDGSGRPPIPQRPAIPERPEDDPGSADEDDRDEKPQVVVLREGKHLTEREAENVRRKERGLPPLPDPKAISSEPLEEADTSSSNPAPKPKTQTPNLSFSSSKGGSKKTKSTTIGKRKAIGDADAEEDKFGAKKGSQQKKKAKKAGKTLLSFGDDEP